MKEEFRKLVVDAGFNETETEKMVTNFALMPENTQAALVETTEVEDLKRVRFQYKHPVLHYVSGHKSAIVAVSSAVVALLVALGAAISPDVAEALQVLVVALLELV